jgi:hypothetical protein
MWGRQTVFTNLPLMAVGEMAVLTNAFTPDYGGGTGSVVNIVTRSGSNDFHGQFLELWCPAETEASLSGFMTTNAASGNDITSDTLGQTSLAISGPVLSQKTHFFLAGEWNREARASPVTSPLAPGTFVGHYRGCSASCVSITKSTTPTTPSFAPISMISPTRIPTESSAEPASQLSPAPFIAALTLANSAKSQPSLHDSSTISACNSSSARQSPNSTR